MRLRKGPRLRLLIVGKVVINDHCALLTIYVHGDCVASGYIDLISKENLFDAVRVLRDRTQGRQEVTVAATSLQNVARLRLVV